MNTIFIHGGAATPVCLIKANLLGFNRYPTLPFLTKPLIIKLQSPEVNFDSEA